MKVTLSVNGADHELDIPPDTRLLEVLRRQLGLLGGKEACGRGECGACTVLVEGRPVMSCLVLAARAGAVETIEGLAEESRALRRAFAAEGAFQCGFCTPGQVVRGMALLRERGAGEELDARRAISGNICRCTGYVGLVRALRQVAGEGSGAT